MNNVQPNKTSVLSGGYVIAMDLQITYNRDLFPANTKRFVFVDMYRCGNNLTRWNVCNDLFCITQGLIHVIVTMGDVAIYVCCLLVNHTTHV